ncbi:hypothetical protein DYQ86_23110 [Acidobacteria bacterium AB60]|nr:hypothetical protein DYQ86_23110 [Acidobacteria bacterium AB60]
MKHVIAAIFLGLGAMCASAQGLDELNLQIHGYATQGFVYTTQNNVFTMQSSQGSPAWTEAVVNLTARPNPKLRVGVQARYFLLGEFGNDISIDWAMADYKASDKLGFRFGKVKTPSGLFNETQDIDPSYIWVLLPQAIYTITSRTPELSHLGGVVYGAFPAGGDSGKVEYRFWGGEQVIPTGDGDFVNQKREGLGLNGPLMTPFFGGALHWRTPLPGLMVGASDSRYQSSSQGLANGGTENFLPYNIEDYFAQYTHKKLMLAFELNRQAQETTISPAQSAAVAVDFIKRFSQSPAPAVSSRADDRDWYGMATYKFNDKLSAGFYHMQGFDRQADLGPDRYTKDWTVTGRYDFNEFIYAKVEEHFIDGADLNYFEAQNRNGVKPDTRMTAIKLGVSF